MKAIEKNSTGLKRVFGLVSRCDTTKALILARSRIAFAPVLHQVASGASDQSLHDHFSGIKPEEIKTVKAYLSRFGPDVSNPAPLPAGPKALLLDENISFTLIPWATKTFGTSSHVEAEGLGRLNLSPQNARTHRKGIDSSICDFALTHKFSGILTCDTDFIKLSRIPGHPARDVHIFVLDGRDHGIPIHDRLAAHTETMRKTLNASPARLTLLKL